MGISRMHVYSANVVGSDAYWSKKGRELEALVQQKEIGTAFFTMSFADNHWNDLHRLMPGLTLEPKKRYQNILKILTWRTGTFPRDLPSFSNISSGKHWIWNGFGIVLSGNPGRLSMFMESLN